MARAIITGSFDPVTSGHENLIRRASPLFEEVTVVILANTEKKSGLFDPADRLAMVQACIDATGLTNVKAILYGGLTSDAAHELGADYIIRGARNATDFDYEYNLSLIMKRFDPAFETIILPTDPTLSMISSTYVRDLLKYGCELGDAVPEACREMMRELYNNR
ncbi:MAG: pantetheine-phosphate adenylyltransferase [Clostridia bacterium]|nr:pantetheine-phosphate adenylyltransferase [Clostridia bacterium]MBQ8512683.1 pantetheine-phosphate adenylyltransferase [Clostridia bacterium]